MPSYHAAKSTLKQTPTKHIPHRMVLMLSDLTPTPLWSPFYITSVIIVLLRDDLPPVFGTLGGEFLWLVKSTDG